MGKATDYIGQTDRQTDKVMTDRHDRETNAVPERRGDTDTRQGK